MSSNIVRNKPGVEVNIWVAKDAKGNYVNAFKGGLEESKGGRVGHASMKIFLSAQEKVQYSHLMRRKDHVYISLWPGRFEASIEDDINLEGERPNTVIRLNELNTSVMLAELNTVMNVANWTLKAKTKTPLALSAESCASFVYKLLEIGGIFEKSRYEKTSYSGPSRKFYNETNCHLGDMVLGLFNSFGWRGWAISPKLVQHIAASAAESNSTDKDDTLALMKSDLVHKDLQTSNVITLAAPLGAAVSASTAESNSTDKNDTLALMKSDLVHKDLKASYDNKKRAIAAAAGAVIGLSIIGALSLGVSIMKK